MRLVRVDLEGTARGGADGFRLIYIGEGESLDYFRDFWFSSVSDEVSTTIPLRSLRGVVRELLSSTTPFVVETNRFLDFLVPAGGQLSFPWIRQKVFLGGKGYLERRRKIEDIYGRKVRKYKYTFKTVRDESAVVRFYNEFYVPYAKFRFKGTCYLRSVEEFQSAIGSGFLLQVFEGKRWVAGDICRLKNNELVALAIGLIPDYAYYLRRGALSAAYYFILKLAKENGIEKVDLMRSRPHSDDGVYNHKHKWGARPVKDSWPHTSIRIFVPDKSAAPEVLRNQLVWDGVAFVELGKVKG